METLLLIIIGVTFKVLGIMLVLKLASLNGKGFDDLFDHKKYF